MVVFSPVGVGRPGAVARFGTFEPPRTYDYGTLPAVPSAGPARFCTGINGVIGLSIDASGTLFIANESAVSLIMRGSNSVSGTLLPVLAPGETIRAIALAPNGLIELAIAKRPAADASPLSAATTRFAVYRATANGPAQAVRGFACATLRGPVDAISIDSVGRTYAATEGAQIAIFGPDLSGNVRPAELLDGPQTGLRPSLAAGPRGSRPLAFDAEGALYAADDGVIVSYAFQQEAHTHIVPGTPVVAGPRAGLALVVGLATDTRFFLYAVSDDPDTHEHSLVVFRGYYRTFLSGTPQRIATVPL